MIYTPIETNGVSSPHIRAAAAKKAPGKQSEVWRSELSEKGLQLIDQQVPVGSYSTLATCMLVLVSKYQQAGRECCGISKQQISAEPAEQKVGGSPM